jgi:hypothetical protein
LSRNSFCTLDELDILRAVVAAPAAALHRLDLREARFPKPQHVLRQVEIFGHFADGAEGVGALVHGVALQDRIATHFSGLRCIIQAAGKYAVRLCTAHPAPSAHYACLAALALLL